MESVSKQKASDGVLPESSSFILHCCQLIKSHKTAKFQSCPKLGVILFPLVINCNCKGMPVMWLDVHCCGFLEYIVIFIWKMKSEISVWDKSLISLMSAVLSCSSFVVFHCPSLEGQTLLCTTAKQHQALPFPPAPQLLQSCSAAAEKTPNIGPRPQPPNSEQDSMPLLETQRGVKDNTWTTSVEIINL